MLHELPGNEYNKITNLLHKDFISVQCQTVINRTNPGFIYVDSIDDPKTAIVFHQGESGFYFVGDHENPKFNPIILEFLQSNLKERLLKLGLDCFEFSGDSPAWDERFKKVFANTDLWESKQRIYVEGDNHSIISGFVDPGIHLHEINIDQINNNSFREFNFIYDEVFDFWNNWEEFTLYGGGLFLTIDNEVIGKCVADGVTNKHIAVRIEIKETYRNRGIATYLASKFIEWVSTHEKSTYWECAETNIGSIRIAEKNGLTLSKRYSLFGFKINWSKK